MEIPPQYFVLPIEIGILTHINYQYLGVTKINNYDRQRKDN